MLLQNISPKEGLCNGSKLIFDKLLDNKLLICKFSSSDKTVLIPKIKFIADSKFYAFEWSRRQFLILIAFSTTINNAQGQTLKNVGVWLRSPVFTHGQLYVASSRTGDPDQLKFAVMQQPGEPLYAVVNVVYNEILLNNSDSKEPSQALRAANIEQHYQASEEHQQSGPFMNI